MLHSFNWELDGDMPLAGLLMDAAGNLYGITEFLAGYSGDVFKVSSTGVFTVLHAFTSPPEDGRYPAAGLFRDKAGNLYGTTQAGGSGGDNGTVFEIDKDGVEPCCSALADRTGRYHRRL